VGIPTKSSKLKPLLENINDLYQSLHSQRICEHPIAINLIQLSRDILCSVIVYTAVYIVYLRREKLLTVILVKIWLPTALTNIFD